MWKEKVTESQTSLISLFLPAFNIAQHIQYLPETRSCFNSINKVWFLWSFPEYFIIKDFRVEMSSLLKDFASASKSFMIPFTSSVVMILPHKLHDQSVFMFNKSIGITDPERNFLSKIKKYNHLIFNQGFIERNQTIRIYKFYFFY